MFSRSCVLFRLPNWDTWTLRWWQALLQMSKIFLTDFTPSYWTVSKCRLFDLVRNDAPLSSVGRHFMRLDVDNMVTGVVNINNILHHKKVQLGMMECVKDRSDPSPNSTLVRSQLNSIPRYWHSRVQIRLTYLWLLFLRIQLWPPTGNVATGDLDIVSKLKTPYPLFIWSQWNTS